MKVTVLVPVSKGYGAGHAHREAASLNHCINYIYPVTKKTANAVFLFSLVCRGIIPLHNPVNTPGTSNYIHNAYY